jgi:hypothetical protein
MQVRKSYLRDATVRAAVVLMLFAAVVQAGAAHAATLIGAWRGAYAYSDGQAPVPLVIDITQTGDAISGRTTELATFGTGGSRYLYATITGSTSGQSVTFRKTYDGTGGQSHSVEYTGALSADGSVITGSWSIGAVRGTWRVILDPRL